jgi:hypothetical protein
MAGQKSTRKRTSSRAKVSATTPAPAAETRPGVTAQGALSADVSIRERIALLAYSYWEARGRQGGPREEEEDWLRAEREVLSSLPDTGQ